MLSTINRWLTVPVFLPQRLPCISTLRHNAKGPTKVRLTTNASVFEVEYLFFGYFDPEKIVLNIEIIKNGWLDPCFS